MLASFDTLKLLAFLVPLGLLCFALTLIDIRHGIIPDGVNLAIAGLGVLNDAVSDGLMTGACSVIEAVAIGAIFWLLRRLYFAWRKFDGLGLGDVKFLAAATPWIGVAGIPMLLLIATLAALAAAGGLRLAGHAMTRQTSLPFGPFLATGLLLTLAAQPWLGPA
jgi:leader peptidase (prepilin peptidase) / N-methyltransferase